MKYILDNVPWLAVSQKNNLGWFVEKVMGYISDQFPLNVQRLETSF